MMLMNNSLPKNWVISCVGDVYKILESGSRPSGGIKAFSKGIPSIGAEHINNRGGFNFTHIRYVPDEFASTVRRGKIELEDILIVKDGATTGRVSFVHENFPYRSTIISTKQNPTSQALDTPDHTRVTQTVSPPLYSSGNT